LVLQDSDDYELIITCLPENVVRIRSIIAEISDVSVSELGKITDKEGDMRLILPDGSEYPLSPKGWDHFLK